MKKYKYLVQNEYNLQALSSQPKFQEILLHYVQSFKEMLEFSAAEFSEETNLLLIEGLQTIRLRHLDTVPHMAAAIQAMQADQAGAMTCDNIQAEFGCHVMHIVR